jgi:single-strand DNA-binding protein
VNRWFGIGNLTDDPEMRYTPQGTEVTSFSIAINNGKDRDGNEREPTYVDIVAWEKTAENVAEYCRKGNKVAIEGALQVDKWKDDDGNNRKRYLIRAFSVEFLTPRSKDDDDRRPARRDRDDRPARRDDRPARRAPRDDLDDLPF